MSFKDIIYVLIGAAMICIPLVIQRFFCSSPSRAPIVIRPEINKVYERMKRRKMTTAEMLDKIATHKTMKGLTIVREIPDKCLVRPGMSIGEFISLDTLNRTFPNDEFVKIRPKWLKNPKTNRNLELDMWNETRRIALEYQGSQHYYYPNSFHPDPGCFNDQVERDSVKSKLCKKNKVTLLIVPYNIPHEHIPTYIYCELITKWKTRA